MRTHRLVADPVINQGSSLAAPTELAGRYIKTEAADFESYENCATVASLTEYLGARGFHLTRQDRFATHPSLGAYYDILFEKAPG